MKSKWFSGGNFNLSNAADRYSAAMNAVAWTAAEQDHMIVCPTDGYIRNLYVRLDGTPGSGKSYAFTLYVDGVASNLTVTIADTDYVGADVVHSVHVTAGQTLSLFCHPDGTPTTRSAKWILEYEGDTENETVLGGNTYTGTVGATSVWFPIAGYEASGSSAANTNQVFVAPCAGTIKKIYARLGVAPGAGKTRLIFISINGSTTRNAGEPLVTIAGASDTTGNSGSSDSIAVAAGDLVCAYVTSTALTASSRIQVGCVFCPTTNGQFIIPRNPSNSTALSGSADRYVGPTYGGSVGSTNTVWCIGHTDFSIIGARVKCFTDPTTVTSSYNFKLQAGASDASEPFSMTVEAGSTTESASGTFTPVAYSSVNAQLAVLAHPVNSPVPTEVAISYTGYIAPTVYAGKPIYIFGQQ